MKNKIKSVMNKISKRVTKTFVYILALSNSLIIAVCDDKDTKALTSDADKKFTLIVNTIASYGFKFGLLIIFYGAIQIGLAFKNDNPDGKVQGARTAVAGLIVAAVSSGADKFIS